ncbi:MAG: dephospho-CoA kinase [Candidatus Coproplasma sp.]
MKQSKIAVTGGIGSGKSTACKIIKSLGYPVYSCDEVYNQIINDKWTVAELAENFGKEIQNQDGSLNKAKLSEIVFNDKNKLEKLNSITHPKIFEKMFLLSANDEGAVFYEVPLLFEGNYQNLFDGVIVLMRDEKTRIRSVAERDSISEEKVFLRINNQYNYNNCDFAKYYVIHNDGNFDELQYKIEDLLFKITNQ